jgi:hypothetical protein
MRIPIKITQTQLKKLQDLAKARNAKSKRFGEQTYNNKQTGNDTHLIGLLGEFAVSQHFEVPLDENIYDNHGDVGADFVLEELGRTEVKTTTYISEPLLRVPIDSISKKTDAYILCAIDKKDYSRVYIIGWLNAKKVIQAKQKKLSRYGPKNYIVEENQLKNVPLF